MWLGRGEKRREEGEGLGQKTDLGDRDVSECISHLWLYDVTPKLSSFKATTACYVTWFLRAVSPESLS